ncbi:MAG TPA: hypothetical protein VNY06_06245, partial [Methylocella sp.]|nr:hypothetical protein [Methylocella sp.]
NLCHLGSSFRKNSNPTLAAGFFYRSREKQYRRMGLLVMISVGITWIVLTEYGVTLRRLASRSIMPMRITLND